MACKTTTITKNIACATFCESQGTQTITKITFDGKYISTQINLNTLYKWFVLIDDVVIYESAWEQPTDNFDFLNNGSVYSNILVGLNGNILKNTINALLNTKIDKTNNLSLYLLTKRGEIINKPSNKIHFQI